MTNTKMTYAIALTSAIDALTSDANYGEVVEKLSALRETLAKRNANKGERKPTKVQRENESIKEHLVTLLTSHMTASEVADTTGMSVQKVSALLNQMVEDGRVVKTPAKGKVKTSFIAASAVVE